MDLKKDGVDPMISIAIVVKLADFTRSIVIISAHRHFLCQFCDLRDPIHLYYIERTLAFIKEENKTLFEHFKAP